MNGQEKAARIEKIFSDANNDQDIIAHYLNAVGVKAERFHDYIIGCKVMSQMDITDYAELLTDEQIKDIEVQMKADEEALPF